MSRFGVVFLLLAQALAVGLTAAEVPVAEDGDALLDGPDRGEWQQPREVMRMLSTRRGEQVAEIGAGKGFFTWHLAARVGAEGKVYAVETDPRLVEHLEEYVAKFPDANGVVVRATAADPGLPVGALDMVMTVNTWHHVEDREAMREAVQRSLKPGGRFVVMDWRVGEIPIAPPEDHRLPRVELLDEMRADGWTLTTDARFLKYQYFLIFTPPAE